MAMALDQPAGRKDPLTDLDELRAVRASVLSLAQRFDPAGLRPVELAEGLRAATVARNPLGTIEALLAKAIKDAQAYEPGEDRSADHFVSRTLGTFAHPGPPRHRGGAAGPPGDGGHDPPGSLGELRRGPPGSLGELKDAARRIRFAAEPDPEAHAADALVEALCGDRGEQPTSAKPKFIVRLDHAAPVRGNVEGDEVCEVVGVGPVSVGAVKELALEEDPFRWQS